MGNSFPRIPAFKFNLILLVAGLVVEVSFFVVVEEDVLAPAGGTFPREGALVVFVVEVFAAVPEADAGDEEVAASFSLLDEDFDFPDPNDRLNFNLGFDEDFDGLSLPLPRASPPLLALLFLLL